MNVGIAINLKDCFGLLAVWKYRQDSYINPWSLIKLTRPKEAISLCNNAPKRFVFPADTNPNRIAEKRNKVWKLGSITPFTNKKKQLKPSGKAELEVLNSIRKMPGQRHQKTAQQMQISHKALKRYLQNLEKRGAIYYYSHPKDNRIRIYFPSMKPASLIDKKAG